MIPSFFSTFYISSPQGLPDKLLNLSHRCFYLGGKKFCIQKESTKLKEVSFTCPLWELTLKVSTYATAIWGALTFFKQEKKKLTKTEKNFKIFSQVTCGVTVATLLLKTFFYFSYSGKANSASPLSNLSKAHSGKASSASPLSNPSKAHSGKETTASSKSPEVTARPPQEFSKTDTDASIINAFFDLKDISGTSTVFELLKRHENPLAMCRQIAEKLSTKVFAFAELKEEHESEEKILERQKNKNKDEDTDEIQERQNTFIQLTSQINSSPLFVQAKSLAKLFANFKKDGALTLEDMPVLFCILASFTEREAMYGKASSFIQGVISEAFHSKNEKRWQDIFKLFFCLHTLGIFIPNSLNLSNWLKGENKATYARVLAKLLHSPEDVFFLEFILKKKEEFTIESEEDRIFLSVRENSSNLVAFSRKKFVEIDDNYELYQRAYEDVCKEASEDGGYRPQKMEEREALKKAAGRKVRFACSEGKEDELHSIQKRINQLNGGEDVKKLQFNYACTLICDCLDKSLQYDKEVLDKLEEHCQFLREFFLNCEELRKDLEFHINILQVLLYAGPPSYTPIKDERGETLINGSYDDSDGVLNKRYFKRSDEAYNRLLKSFIIKAKSSKHTTSLIKMCLNRLKRLPIHRKVASVREKGSQRKLFEGYKKLISYLTENPEGKREETYQAYLQVGGFELDLSTGIEQDFQDQAKYQFILQLFFESDSLDLSHENFRWIIRHLNKCKSTEIIDKIKAYFQERLYKSYQMEWKKLEGKEESLEDIFQLYLQLRLDIAAKNIIQDKKGLITTIKNYLDKGKVQD